jgi:hypothetical protein
LWNDRKPSVSYFKVFGSKCFVLNTKDNLGKFDAKSDEAIFLGYSTTSKAYRIFNKRKMVVEESMNVVFDEVFKENKTFEMNDEDIEDFNNLEIEDDQRDMRQEENPEFQDDHLEPSRSWRFMSSHPADQILTSPSQGMTTRSKLRNIVNHQAFVSSLEPKNFKQAENDPN